MSGTRTARMIAAYNQMSTALMFFSGLFQAPPQNFHNSEEVEIDIQRDDEDIAIVVQDLSTGYRMNSTDIYTNKAFKPPVLKEAVAINSFDLLKREFGRNPFESPNFRADAMTRIMNGMVKIERKIRRTIELQAAQVLQTGTITLTDISGTALYTLNFQPKANHFSTVGTLWDAGGADPAADIKAISEIIRNDGLADPDQLIFGCDAWEAFIKNASIVQRFETRRIDQGTIAPMQMRGQGGNFRGVVEIGNYRYDCWSYGGRYKDPQTGVKTQFMDPKKVIVRASTGRLDATFGAIPNIGASMGANGPQLLPELPGRFTNTGMDMDLFVNAWLTPDGEQLMGGVGSRPLMIPTAIDQFGALTVLA